MPRLLLVILVSSATVQADERPAPTPDEIRTLVGELGHDDFFRREAATRRLWEAGPERAREVLERAAEGDDPEIAFRARNVLWNFEHGIFVDTPPDVVTLIESFRVGNDNQRVEVFRTLADRGLVRTMTALLRSSPNAATRKQLAQVVRPALANGLPKLFESGRFEDALEWLDLAAEATGESGARDRDAFLLLTERLEERIQLRRRELASSADDEEKHARLTALLILSGDLEAAADHAGRSKDGRLRREVALRRGDWATLAGELCPGDEGVERLGFLLAMHFLAGNSEGVDRTAGELVKLAESDSDRAWMSGEALLVSGRFDDALGAFGGIEHSTSAFELASVLGRRDEAFASFGIDVEEAAFDEWFETQVEGRDATGSRRAVARGVAVLRDVVRSRGRAAAEPLLTAIREVARREDVGRVNTVVEVAFDLGFRSEAFQDAAVSLADHDPKTAPSVLRTLFPDRAESTFVWWQFRRRHVAGQEPRESPGRSLAWVADVFDGRAIPEDFEPLVREVLRLGAEQTELATRIMWRRAATDAAFDRGGWQLAAECHRTILEESPTFEHLLRMADLEFRMERWSEAAEAYSRARKADTDNPLAVHLQGIALIRAGEREAGRKLVQLARMMPLGNVSTRRDLASGLRERGFEEESRREWETVLRLGSYSTFSGSDAWSMQVAFARIGNAVSDDEPIRAADHWQRYLLYLLKTNAAYAEVQRYLGVSHMVHRVRARGLIENGRVAEGLAEARRAHVAWPENIELALKLVPRLDERGLDDEAETVFAMVLAPAERRIAEAPEFGGAYNDLAWLQAKCNRRLDEAERHARKAVALEPGNAAYLDTLAEVQFRRGEVAEAIALAKRCLEIDPDGEHYRAQLQRFENR